MRLLQLSNYQSPYAGSFVPMIRAALRLGLERGLRAEAVFPPGARERPWLADLEADGIPVRFVEPGGVGALLDEGREPAILHTHFSLFQVEAAAAVRERAHVLGWWHVHTRLDPGMVAWARNAVRFRALGRGLEEILCVSEHLAADVRRRLAPARKVAFLRNGIDLDRFAPPSDGERAAARERLGLPAGVPVVAHFGRDWLGKGGDVLADAAPRLAERHPGLAIVSFGAADERPGIRRADPTNRVEDVYAAADVFASPSRAEGGAPPYAVAEALAMGTPVAASDIPGQRELAGLAACAVAPLEGAAYAEALDSLLRRDPAARAGDAAAARDWLEQNMDLRVWAERLFERYERAGALPT